MPSPRPPTSTTSRPTTWARRARVQRAPDRRLVLGRARRHGGAFGASAPDADPTTMGADGVQSALSRPVLTIKETGSLQLLRDYEPGTGGYRVDPFGHEGGLAVYGYAFEGPSIFRPTLTGIGCTVLQRCEDRVAGDRGLVVRRCCGGKRVFIARSTICTIAKNRCERASKSCRLPRNATADTTRGFAGDGQPTEGAITATFAWTLGPNPNQYGSECDAYSVIPVLVLSTNCGWMQTAMPDASSPES